MKIDLSLPWHMDLDIDLVAVKIEIDNVHVVRKMDSEIDRVPGLVFLDFEAMVANLVMLGSHASFNGLLVPGIHMDVGVGRFDPELGPSGNRVSLGPLIRARQRGKGYADS
jgi:hypothetical protein